MGFIVVPLMLLMAPVVLPAQAFAEILPFDWGESFLQFYGNILQSSFDCFQNSVLINGIIKLFL